MADNSYEQEYLAELDKSIKRSKRLADRPMFLFILLRLALIGCSSVLPALAAVQSPYLTGFAVAVALMTGLDTHFRWGDEWRHFRKTQLALERLQRDFEYRKHALANGRHVGSVKSDVENLELLHNGVEDLLLSEADEFFKFRITEWKKGE